MQPDWHVDGGRLDMTVVEGSWEPLRQPGINRILSVVAGLFFWGLATCDDAAARDKWLRFIADCIHMFDGLLAMS